LQLGFPESNSRLRTSASRLATMLVPEASMNEYHASTAGKHQVRTARKVSRVKPESVAQRMSQAAHYFLRFGILVPNQ
jgi:hypothetical protein